MSVFETLNRLINLSKIEFINHLFETFSQIRYIAIYQNDNLIFKQKELAIEKSSSETTDKYEELLVNPTLLKLATQRGNIDCGGLNYLIINYGNFHQIVREVIGGHISICLESGSDLNSLPNKIIQLTEDFLN